MKIGILTFVRVESFGANMQCYALSHYISQLGYDVEVIDFPLKPTSKRNLYVYKLYSFFSHFKHLKIKDIFKKIAKVQHTNLQKDTNQDKDLFYEENIIHSELILSPKDLIKHCQKYDAVIVGSDQVWNYVMSSRVDIYLLSFLNKSQRKIAYAASFGVPTIPFFYKKMYQQCLSSFNSISIREESGCKLVKALINKDPELVLDPTLLLTSTQMEAVAKNCPNIPEKYVLIYDLLDSTYLLKYAQYISESKNIPILNLSDFEIGQKITLFKHATFIITSSFHGTTFSIIFRKQFVSVCRKGRLTNSRIEDLLKLLDLEEALLYENNNPSPSFKTIAVNYDDKFNNNFQKALNRSKKFIEQSLSCAY